MPANHVWSHKHSPKRTVELEGQEDPIRQLNSFISGKSRKKAALLYGAVGSGKTASVHIIASELGLEIIELNASDWRDAGSIKSILGAASQQMSLFGKGKLILVDEIDGISGMEDRGGVAALAKVIAETRFPIVMTANDPFDTKLSPLRKSSVLIEFKKLMPEHLARVLKRVCELEGVAFTDDTLKALARLAGGDARAAVNDLQTLASQSRKLEKEELAGLSSRNQEEDMMLALNKILRNTDMKIALGAFDEVDEDIEKCALWLDENIPREYKKPSELAAAYDALSRADVFQGRIRRWQHWRFLSYVYQFMTAGIALAKKQRYESASEFVAPSRILKIWIANSRNFKKKAIAEKLAAKSHSSTKATIRETMPYLRLICKDEKIRNRVAADYGLSPEESQWLGAL